MDKVIKNINSKGYWETRFLKNWNKRGRIQTTEYAKANIQHVSISRDFSGTITDFGCALGDAVPVYSKAFPKAKITGIDFSDAAIKECKKKYSHIASFFSGDYSKVPISDVIIASHVMEHLTNDKATVVELLKRCTDLFIFVPFKETPLFIEHVNYYDENYYDDLNVIQKKVFKVKYKGHVTLISFIKNLLKFRFLVKKDYSKEVIMFHLKA